MAVTDLTSLISPGMQLAQQYQAVPQMQQQSASAAARSLQYAQAEAELQAAYDELERSSTSYNELVDSYNTAESAAEQAIYDSMLQEKAAEYNAAVRRYNEAGNRYQSAGVISGFSVIPEFTPEKTELKPTLSALPENQPTVAKTDNWWMTPGYQTFQKNLKESLNENNIDKLNQPLLPGIVSTIKDTAERVQDNIVKANDPLLPKDEQQRIISNIQNSPQLVGTAADVTQAVIVSGTKPQEQRENLRYLTEPLLPRETQQGIIDSVRNLPEAITSRDPIIPQETQKTYIDNGAKLRRAGEIALATVFSDSLTKMSGAVVDVVNFAQTPANATPEEQAALKQQRVDVISGALNSVFPLAPDTTVSAVSESLAGKTDAELQKEQYDYMTKLGKAQIGMGAALSPGSPQAGQLLKDSGSEILVSRDYYRYGLFGGPNGINRPSIYEAFLFGSALGAFGAALGTGAVTGVSGFGPLIARTAPLAIEGEAVAAGAVSGGGRAAGQALANAAAAEKTAQTALAGASALGISLSEVDYGIGDVLDQYPRRDEDRTVNNPMPGEVGIGRGILDEYPGRDQYGNRNRNQYNRNNSNRNQDWNRSELDYRGSVGSGYSTRLVEDSVLRTRNQEENRNRYRYEYEYDHVTEAAPRSRRSVSWQEEEESVIAQPRRKQKGSKKHFTERLIL